MKVDVILGLQWGDEGKGKIVDAFAPGYDIIARFQGGPNAGHTIEFDAAKFVLHTIPSGIFRQEVTNVIGNGVVIDPFIWNKEIDMIESAGFNPRKNLVISDRAHLILPSHRLLDYANEMAMGTAKIGSTLKGIGPAYTDKISRKGLRVGDILKPDFEEKYQKLRAIHLADIESLKTNVSDFMPDKLSYTEYEQKWFEALEVLRTFKITSTEVFLNEALAQGKKVLAEGAQGTMLDVDFGSYPYVTSSNTSTGGVCTGLGIPPQKIGKVFGIFKAYCTRVGNGPFPTELDDEYGTRMQKQGNEYGSTTGRPRRCGWLDLAALKHSVMINGVTDLIMTKADVLDGFDKLMVAESYKENSLCSGNDHCTPVLTPFTPWKDSLNLVKDAGSMPAEFMAYMKYIESILSTPVSCVSVGPAREQIIKM